ncbi:MAG: PspC domain-containing protein, partial [Nanoarchaeota archaeon]
SSGMAEYFNVDVVFVRLLWVVLGLLSAGTAVIAYIIAAFIIPEKETVGSTKKTTTSKTTTEKTSKKATKKKSEQEDKND